jgi:hypothetical protein
MKPIDLIGMGPKREARRNIGGGWIVTVTPPDVVGLPGNSLVLSEDQYQRYLEWHEGGCLIQEALPDLTSAQREVLMTGLTEV